MTESQIHILHKELDLIEAAIERMARNSFMIKGWALSLAAIVVALSKLSVTMQAITILLPMIGFWWLDAYYLRLERAFRKVYEDRIAKRTGGDWINDLYSVKCTKFMPDVASVRSIMYTSSTLPFYGIIVILLIIVALLQIDWSSVISFLPHFCSCSHHGA